MIALFEEKINNFRKNYCNFKFFEKEAIIMPKEKYTNSVYKDVFHAFLVEKANYAGQEEIPCIKTSNKIPTARDGVEKIPTFAIPAYIIILTNARIVIIKNPSIMYINDLPIFF